MFALFLVCELAYAWDYLPHLLLRSTRYSLYISAQWGVGSEFLIKTECLHIEFTCGIYGKLWHARKQAIGNEGAKVNWFVWQFINWQGNNIFLYKEGALKLNIAQVLDFVNFAKMEKIIYLFCGTLWFNYLSFIKVF